jgi:branched-chain amino acid transport system permease protein
MSRLTAGKFHENYAHDETFSIFQTNFRKGCFIFFIAFFLSLPALLSNYLIYIMNIWGIAIIAVCGLHILLGMTGQISLGHGIFVGVGGVTAGILSSKLNAPLWITIPSAGIVAAVIGTIVGTPALRLKRFYLALATLAGHYIIFFIIWNWEWACGSKGINLTPAVLFGMDISPYKKYYYLVLFLVVILFWLTANLRLTRVGRAFQAIRDRDLAAEVLGIQLWKYKLFAFAISSFYAGIAGAVLVHMLTLVPPENFSIGLSIEYLAMVIVGGVTSLFGVLLGSFFMTILPFVLESILENVSRILPHVDMGSLVSGGREIFFGLSVMLFLIFEPDGLAKIWRDLFSYFKLWPFSY